MFAPDTTVLFQGDSITDCGRNREVSTANDHHALGLGYAKMAAAALLAEYPAAKLNCYNRGIGGNIVQQLEERWQEDCLDLKPDVMSVLIGINDTARPFNGGDCTPQQYDACFRSILDAARTQNPKLRLAICEPFLVVVSEDQKQWAEGFEARRAIAQQIAADYDAVWVPFQTLFESMLEEAPASYWIPDGIHPSIGGHHRMAELWIETTRAAWGAAEVAAK